MDPADVFAIHDQSPCATCHHVFDNYGAALQRFDVETSLYDPTNDWLGDSFDLSPVGDVAGPVGDPGALGHVIGASQQAAQCMTELWYRNAIRRDTLAGDVDKSVIEELFGAWQSSGDMSLLTLLEEIVAREDFAEFLL